MGTTGIGTPVRRRVGGINSMALPSLQDSGGLCQQANSPTASNLHINQQNNNMLSTSAPAQGGNSSADTLTAASLDLSQPGLSRSFDPFPFSEVKRRLKRDAKSLEDCATTVSILPPTPPSPNPLPNGGALHHEDEVSPLLPQRPPKRWRSLEDGSGLVVVDNNDDDIDQPFDSTTADTKVARGSLKTWLVGLLNGNNRLKGGGGSQASLRKNVYSLPGTTTTSSTPGINFESQTQQFSQLCQANVNEESIV